MKKVVIVNYTMPPYPGIGGRRWSKFTKYLQRQGLEVQVFAAERAVKNYTPWLKDTKEYADRITYIHPKYPKILATIPNNFVQKLRYKIALEFVKISHGKANYFDPSRNFGKRVTKNIANCIDAGYKNVIVSCGPFHMCAEIIKLKVHYPAVNFIVDFRDPWANNGTTFGFMSIGEDRLMKERELERNAVSLYDSVISVSDEMSEYFKNITGQDSKKFITIPNGFDKEDFPKKDPVRESSSDRMRFVFTGTVYEKTQHIFQELVRNLLNIKTTKPLLYEHMQFDFYGKVPVWFENETAACQDIIKFYGEVSLDEVYTHIANANVCLLFLTDDLTYSRSTKFYEYLVAGKPIAVFSKGGETAEYVANNGAGYACNSGAMTQELERIYEEWKMDKLRVNKSLDISKLDTQKLSESVAQLLI